VRALPGSHDCAARALSRLAAIAEQVEAVAIEVGEAEA
jgi:hypothetical protein